MLGNSLRRILITGVLLFVLTTLSSPSFGEVPYRIDYQGVLLSDGEPVTSTVTATFAIYGTATGGTSLWSEPRSVTPDSKGVFSIVLGEVTDITEAVFSSADRWLGVQIGGEPELSPRMQLVTAPYAFRISTVDGASGGAIDGNVSVFGTAEMAGFTMLTGASTDYVLTCDVNGVGTWQEAGGSEGDITEVTAGDGLTGGALTGACTLSVETGGIEDFMLATNSVNTTKIQNGTIQFNDIGSNGAITGQVMKWNGATWVADNDSAGGGSKWSVTDSVLYTNKYWGIARGGAGNVLYDNRYTMVNLGVSCTTGTSSDYVDNVVIGGGWGNRASGDGSTIAGGTRNVASYNECTIGGGDLNKATGHHATVAGGYKNDATGDASFVGGGDDNDATGYYSMILGGNNNTASGYCSNAIGCDVVARGDHSFAGGTGAIATHDGTFVWADASDADIESTVPNQFLIRASGGTKIFSNPELSAGVIIHPGASAWAVNSDRNLKENFNAVDGPALLEKIANLPITEWNYKTQNENIKHIGPVAQDFIEIFGLGDDDKTISTIDPAGIALAGVKELHKNNQELKAEVAALKILVEQLLYQNR